MDDEESTFRTGERREDLASIWNEELPPGRPGEPELRLQADVFISNSINPEAQPPSDLNTAERRRECRFPTDDAASLLGVSPVQTQRMRVRVRDVSRSGMRLWAPEPLTPGSIIQLRLKTLLVTAEVRYCCEAKDGYYAGVRIEDVFPSS